MGKSSVEYEVETLLDKRVKKFGKRYRTEYLVKWVGDYEPTWEPKSNISSLLIEEFEQNENDNSVQDDHRQSIEFKLLNDTPDTPVESQIVDQQVVEQESESTTIEEHHPQQQQPQQQTSSRIDKLLKLLVVIIVIALLFGIKIIGSNYMSHTDGKSGTTHFNSNRNEI